jgi:molecular chaperone GrpE
MSEPQADDFSRSDAPIPEEVLAEGPPDVSFIVPASAYDSIATDEELARPPEPQPIPAPLAFVEPDLTPALKAIEGLGETLSARLDGLATRFDREIRAESTREKVVDRLHAELQEYKGDLLLSAMRPIFVDLIQLHDDVGKMASSFGESGDDSGKVAALLAGIQKGIEDILYRQGIEPFSLDGEAFDARRQRAVTTVPTEDASLARKIAERHRKGFAAGDRVIRPEIVSVYTARPAESGATA